MGDHKRRILAAEQRWARSEGLMRALVERGVYVIGGLTHEPNRAVGSPPARITREIDLRGG